MYYLLLWKSCQLLLPLLHLFFHYMLPQKYINLQIRLFIDTLYIMRKPVYGHLTHILQK